MRKAQVLAAALCVFSGPVAAQDVDPSQVVQAFAMAWDASDAKQISNLFTADADFVAADGVLAKGRSQIAAYYAAAFTEGFSGSNGIGEVIQQRRLSPDLVLLDARFTIKGAHNHDGSKRNDQKGMMAAVLSRQGEAWRIVALRERAGSVITPVSGGR